MTRAATLFWTKSPRRNRLLFLTPPSPVASSHLVVTTEATSCDLLIPEVLTWRLRYFIMVSRFALLANVVGRYMSLCVTSRIDRFRREDGGSYLATISPYSTSYNSHHCIILRNLPCSLRFTRSALLYPPILLPYRRSPESGGWVLYLANAA